MYSMQVGDHVSAPRPAVYRRCWTRMALANLAKLVEASEGR
jgi:hypothetical protein